MCGETKGGDPAIFGRITEEVQTLENHHIHYEIVWCVSKCCCSNYEYGINDAFYRTECDLLNWSF